MSVNSRLKLNYLIESYWLIKLKKNIYKYGHTDRVEL